MSLCVTKRELGRFESRLGRRRNLFRVVIEIAKDDGERKLVTVLFADVKGSMDMAEQHDPEQWREAIAARESAFTRAEPA